MTTKNPRLALAGRIRQADARNRTELAQELRTEQARERLARMPDRDRKALIAALETRDADQDDE